MSANAQKYLNAALDILQREAVNRARLNWPAIRRRALATASAATTPADTYVAIATATGELDVNGHSWFVPPPIGTTAAGAVRPSSRPSGRLLAGQIGYVALPAVGSESADGYRAGGAAAVRALQAQHPAGWIVDLRSNEGGDVWPMLGVIQPLLGSGTIASFVSPPAADAVVRITPTVQTDDGQVAIRMPAAVQQGASRAPVVVLTGPITASAGELVAIAFRGRPCTTSMGAATYGVPTGTQEFSLSDGATLILTTAFEADRTGHVYPDAPIQPDVKIGADTNATWSPADPAIRAASGWLGLHRRCGQ